MKKLRFGIVGTGTIAHRFANAIKNVEEAELVAVASRTKENADKFGDEFDIPVRFDSYEKMAQSDAIDAAYIAVPHSGHITCSCLMRPLPGTSPQKTDVPAAAPPQTYRPSVH